MASRPLCAPLTARRQQALTWNLFMVAALLLAVSACGKKKDQTTSGLPTNLPNINFGGGGATPSHSMSRYEYPFDAAGNYQEEWAAQGERLAGRSTTSSAQPSATVRRSSTPARSSTASSGSRATTHTVARGDTLYSISRRYGTTVARIRSANGIRGDVIRPGQRLTIPR